MKTDLLAIQFLSLLFLSIVSPTGYELSDPKQECKNVHCDQQPSRFALVRNAIRTEQEPDRANPDPKPCLFAGRARFTRPRNFAKHTDHIAASLAPRPSAAKAAVA
jgi:hypothetical protein